MRIQLTVFIVVLFAFNIIGATAFAVDASLCKTKLTPSMIEQACGKQVTVRNITSKKKKSCYASYRDKQDGQLLFQIFAANNTNDSANRFKRKLKSAKRRSAPAKVQKRKNKGQSYIESFKMLEGVGEQAYSIKVINPATHKHHFDIFVLSGLNHLQLSSSMGLTGKKAPCNAEQLHILARKMIVR